MLLFLELYMGYRILKGKICVNGYKSQGFSTVRWKYQLSPLLTLHINRKALMQFPQLWEL